MASHNNIININICEFPNEILEKIFSYCSYEEISGLRLICNHFNQLCQQLLTQGFSRVDKFHAQVQKDVKCKLPRRESERRNHPLAKHVNVLSSIETRLSLLSMTFLKYIDLNLCCFIPGKVLDELLHVLRAVSKTDLQPRAHELLQELRDISSMAMEHFDEHIMPRLKAKIPSVPPCAFVPPGCSTSRCEACSDEVTSSSIMAFRRPPVRQELHQLRSSLRNNSLALATVRRELSSWRTRTDADRTSGLEQTRRLAELARELSEAQKKTSRYEAQMVQQQQQMQNLEHELAHIKLMLGVKDSNKKLIGDAIGEKKSNDDQTTKEDDEFEERPSRKRKHGEKLSLGINKQQRI